MKEVYWTREQLVTYLADNYKLPTEIANALKFVEGCFILASSDDARVFVFEVPEDFDRDSLEKLTLRFLETVDVPVLFVPNKLMKYRATLKAESMGIKGKVKMLREKIRKISQKTEEGQDKWTN